MSQVLALEAGTKRPFDAMAIDQPSAACSPHRISFLAPPPAAKRMRSGGADGLHWGNAGTEAPKMDEGGERARESTTKNATGRTDVKALTREQAEEMFKHVPKRLRRLVAHTVARGGASTERLFTINDVREIASSVAAEREAKVREECDSVIQERLTDQWKVFTKYHEDFVARAYRNRDLTYLS